MDLELLVYALDLVSTFAFALVAARVAANKGLDYGGILFIAAIASISGGTLRNIFLGQRPPWIAHPWLFLPIITAVVITIVIGKKQEVGRFALSLDTLGLAVATVSSAQFALSQQAPALVALVLAIVGAVTGGLLRDILCQLQPVLLHRETIGTSALAGAIFYVVMTTFEINQGITAAISGLAVVVVREISIKFNWNLPKVISS